MHLPTCTIKKIIGSNPASNVIGLSYKYTQFIHKGSPQIKQKARRKLHLAYDGILQVLPECVLF